MFIMANHGEKTAAMAISCYEYICLYYQIKLHGDIIMSVWYVYI